MMKISRPLTILILTITVVVISIYFVLRYSIGYNFVHDRPASDEYYQNISGRIYFTSKYRGDKFDTLLSTFIKSNSQYSLPDSLNSKLLYQCNCNCLPLRRLVYFENYPKEIYYLTYDYSTMYGAGAGVIDLIFSFENNEWLCTKTSMLDSIEKVRIENRFETAILEKIQ